MLNVYWHFDSGFVEYGTSEEVDYKRRELRSCLQVATRVPCRMDQALYAISEMVSTNRMLPTTEAAVTIVSSWTGPERKFTAIAVNAQPPTPEITGSKRKSPIYPSITPIPDEDE